MCVCVCMCKGVECLHAWEFENISCCKCRALNSNLPWPIFFLGPPNTSCSRIACFEFHPCTAFVYVPAVRYFYTVGFIIFPNPCLLQRTVEGAFCFIGSSIPRRTGGMTRCNLNIQTRTGFFMF